MASNDVTANVCKIDISSIEVIGDSNFVQKLIFLISNHCKPKSKRFSANTFCDVISVKYDKKK